MRFHSHAPGLALMERLRSTRKWPVIFTWEEILSTDKAMIGVGWGTSWNFVRAKPLCSWHCNLIEYTFQVSKLWSHRMCFGPEVVFDYKTYCSNGRFATYLNVWLCDRLSMRMTKTPSSTFNTSDVTFPNTVTVPWKKDHPQTVNKKRHCLKRRAVLDKWQEHLGK